MEIKYRRYPLYYINNLTDHNYSDINHNLLYDAVGIKFLC